MGGIDMGHGLVPIRVFVAVAENMVLQMLRCNKDWCAA